MKSIIWNERKQKRRRKGRRWWRSRGGATKQLLLCLSPLLCYELIPLFFFAEHFSSLSVSSLHYSVNDLIHSLFFFFCWTLLCMWFLTFSFFALYFFLKFPKLSTWLLTLALDLEILKTFNSWIKDERNPLLLFSFSLCINPKQKKKQKKLWPLSPMMWHNVRVLPDCLYIATNLYLEQC